MEEVKAEIKSLKKQIRQNKDKFKQAAGSSEKFKLFFENKKLTQIALCENLLFITRRILIITFALNFDQPDNYYVAIFVFNALSFLKVFFLVVARPLQPPSENHAEALNEFMTLALG